jgi:type IV secretion system protein VirD4
MQASRFQWDQIVIAMATVLFAIWAAMQWQPGSLACRHSSAMRGFISGGFRSLRRQRFFWWWLLYDAYAPLV